jgi:hypothetical protein
MLAGVTQETIEQMRSMIYGNMYGGPGPLGLLRKTGTTSGITQGTGLVWFDLEAAAKRIYAAHSPLRAEVPRVGLTGVGFGTAANWRAIVNINNSNVFAGVSEGHRGGQIQYQEKDVAASYKGLGYESFVNFEAEYAALGFDDVLQLATITLLQAMFVGEEQMILWGNSNTSLSYTLGTTPTPTVVDAGGSGSGFTATVQTVVCAALTPYGVLLAGGLVPPGTTALYTVSQALVDQVTRTNADATTDTINGGHAILSAAGTVTPTSGHNITATVTGVKGAAGYAWYLGYNGGATNYLAAITAIPTVTFTSTVNTGNQTSTTVSLTNDRSQNALAFDGLITQAYSASGWATGGIFSQMAQISPAAGGAYYTSLAGAALTGTANQINEIDTALRWLWNVYRIYPDEIWVSAYQANKITAIAMPSGNPSYRIDITGNQGRVIAGALVTTYVNKYALGGATMLPIRVHPYMPDSWIFFNLKTVTDKYPLANVTVPARVKARREYYSVAWPVTTRQRQYGVYVDEVLEHYVPFALGIMQDVG